MGRIGIYGGSFNPVHNGHVLAAKEFIRELNLDKLLVIPAGLPPHKELAVGSPDGATRTHLLRLAMDGIEKVEIDERELHREGKSYTYDTVCELLQEYPNDELYLLMGTDMFLYLPQWYRYKELLSLVKIGVLDRAERSQQETITIPAMAEQLKLTCNANIEFVKNNFIDVSSTVARRMLMLGCGEEYVPSAVYDEIKKQKLYSVDCNLRNLPFEQLRDYAMTLYDPNRASHAMGCCETAALLAMHHGADEIAAARAGILHDITKAMPAREQLRLSEKYAIMTDEYRGEQTKLLHGKTAAAVAGHIFGECTEVCEAISWHTTGRANMSLLEKIIYLADYIEPNREFPGVEELRKLSYADIDAAMLLGINMTIDMLNEKKRPLNRFSLEAREYLGWKG